MKEAGLPNGFDKIFQVLTSDPVEVYLIPSVQQYFSD